MKLKDTLLSDSLNVFLLLPAQFVIFSIMILIQISNEVHGCIRWLRRV